MLERIYQNGSFFAGTVRICTATRLHGHHHVYQTTRIYILDERVPGNILERAKDEAAARRRVDDLADSDRYGIVPGAPADFGYTLWEGPGTLRHWALPRIEDLLIRLQRGDIPGEMTVALQARPYETRVVRVRLDEAGANVPAWAWSLRYTDGSLYAGRLVHWARRTEEQVKAQYAKQWNASLRNLRRELADHHMELTPVHFTPVPPEAYAFESYRSEVISGYSMDFMAPRPE